MSNKKDASSLFDRIAQQQREKSVETPASSSSPAPTPQKRQKSGKRSDPDYLQVGAYIPKSLNKQVKRLLIDEEKDFSGLVTELLEEWVKRHGA